MLNFRERDYESLSSFFKLYDYCTWEYVHQYIIIILIIIII